MVDILTPESVIVEVRTVTSVAEAARRITRRGKPVVLGQQSLDELDAYTPIAAVELPDTPRYRLIDLELGAGTRNMAPETALQTILAAGRSPLTLDEGIAVVLHEPEAIAPN